MKDVETKPMGLKSDNFVVYKKEQHVAELEKKISFIVRHSERFEEFMETLEKMKKKVFENI